MDWNSRTKKVTGLDYEGKRVVVLGNANKGFQRTVNKTTEKTPSFRQFLRIVPQEHRGV